jgi:hypothetical protein
MNPLTHETYRTNPDLAFRVHAAARRERARAIGRLFAHLVEKVSAPRPPQLLAARWG